MKKVFTLLILSVLTGVLGNRALAQSTTETIDFSGWNSSNGSPYANLTWSGNSINSITATDGLGLTRTYTDRFTVENKDNWRLWADNGTYLQLNGATEGTVYIHNLNEGDHVTVVKKGHCTIMSSNTQSYGNETNAGRQYNGEELTITANGTVELKFYNDWEPGPGIRSITIQEGQGQGQQQDPDPIVQKDQFFNYDPGYEVYDFFEVRDQIYKREDNGNYTSDYPNGPIGNTANTDYTISDAGFDLNGSSAKFFTYKNEGEEAYEVGLTLNNRIAISQNDNNNDGNIDRWRFQRGLIAPSEGSAYFSIANLKKGDRVQIFYLGEAPVFASQADGTYNGCSAFYDRWNDGDFNSEDGDHYITPGVSPANKVEYISTREEGTIRRDERLSQSEATLYSSAVYVITEDGHMDFRLSNNPSYTRIVKVYIWSDHQATMIDDYSERDYQYTSHFDITGELQAKEHIVPGGLEVRVGNEVKTQHAIVVASKEGPVSYVNAVDGFKLPGVTGSVEDGIQINFNLGKNNNANNIPTTGTFYKFMPLESGTMKVKFTPYSMYYYRYDIKGNAIYFDEGGRSGGRNHSAWKEEYGRGNEQTVNRKCPYYVKVSSDNGQTFSDATGVAWTGGSSELMNGGVGEFVLEVEAGKIYYLFGGWTSEANGNNTNLNNFDFMFIRDINDGRITPHACGVAELFDVAFTPAKQIYPLAKWVPSGTKADNNLATIVGYQDTELTVKKMSGNITQCDPYIYETTDDEGNTIHKLGIRNIEFKDGENPGGVVLIKFGTNLGGNINYYKVDPVYVFTVAYDANYKSTSAVEAERGHTWDFSSSSLSGLEWEPTQQNVPKRQNGIFVNSSDQNFAAAQTFGTYFNNFFANGETNPVTTSFLYKEMNYVDNGVNRSDWMFNYRLQKNNKNYDPRFLNKYDMEGDNADMVWDTEGIIIQANSNMSCIFNEFGDGNIHASSKDPDRYVGILGGGSFLIPHLNTNDRVIVWMGSGIDTDEMEHEDMRFHITNALDALHNEISESDVYLAGGSQWMGAKGDNNYRGCYHFFAKADGDMKFTLEGSNSICKLYKIQIYRGDRIITNEVVGETSDDKFLLWSRADDPNDPNDQAENGPASNWTLKYFGKDQKLANGQKGNTVNSSLAAQANDFAEVKGSSAVTGAGILSKGLTTSAVTDPTAATYNTFTFEHDLTTIGTFRARAKDMEKNNNYVADYAEHNVTVVLQETQKYPYTWDFTDMTGWSNNISNFQIEDAIMSSSAFTSWPEWFDSADQWNASYEKSSKDVSLWGAAVGNENGYVLRLNTQETPSDYPQDNIFESAQAIGGNQLWANGRVIPESKGLWFHTLDQSTQYGSMRVYDDGMSVAGLDGWCYNMVVPNVPKDAAVYMRIKKARDVGRVASYKFEGSDASNLTLIPVAWKDNDKSKDATEWIVAIKNSNSTKKNLTLSLAGYQLKKLAVSEDPKKIGKTGFATESRERIIDHDLTEYLTGVPVKAYQASFDKEEKPTQVILSHIRFMPAAPGITKNEQGVVTNDGLTNNEGLGCILYNDAEADSNESIGKKVDVLDGGFHLFVPDMHDNEEELTDWDDQVCDTESNILRSCVPAATSNTDRLAATAANGDTRYILSAQPYQNAGEGYQAGDGGKAGLVGFYKVDPTNGAKKTGNIAYMQLGSSQISYSKVSMLFFDELIIEGNSGIATAIETVDAARQIQDGWYNMNGQKLNGAPAAKGLYIVNGKKVLVK